MKEANKIVDLIQNANKIVITSHKSPDGDSIGSSLGLYRFIQALTKSAEICHPDSCPNFIEWAKEDAVIFDFEENESVVTDKMQAADLIFCLDYNSANRLGSAMGEILTSCKAIKVMIDHHLDPDDFVDVSVSEPSVCSTAQLIYELVDASGNLHLMNTRIGAPIYLGIMTDTGSFRFPSVTARTHEIIASLINLGVDHASVHQDTFDNNRIDKLKLRGHIISERLEILTDYKVAIISVTEDIMESFNYLKGDTEGLVNLALSIKGVEVATFFTEKGDDVKISFRSKGELAVNVMANENFDGGGHKYAAGGINHDTIENTIAKFKLLLPKYF
jgi:phosphoesterase RecJ-like protein